MGFDNIGSGKTIDIGSGAGPLSGIDWNYVDVQQTSSTVDTYVFYDNSSDLTVLKTCVITYTAANKCDVNTIEWT